jgi:hypothetical protein
VMLLTLPAPPPPWRSPLTADGAFGQTLIRAPSCYTSAIRTGGKQVLQTYAGIVHGRVVNIDVLNDIIVTWILSEGSNRNTM